MTARVLIALCLLLCACRTYAMIQPGRHRVADAYTVEPDFSWSQRRLGDGRVWTVTGEQLQSVFFSPGIAGGEPIDEGGFLSSVQDLVFREGMSEPEIANLITDLLRRGGAGSVSSSGLRPARFGSAEGFRFDVEFVSSDGLEGRGTCHGAVIDGELYYVLYTAARSHYFDRYAASVDQLVASIAFD